MSIEQDKDIENAVENALKIIDKYEKMLFRIALANVFITMINIGMIKYIVDAGMNSWSDFFILMLGGMMGVTFALGAIPVWEGLGDVNE